MAQERCSVQACTLNNLAKLQYKVPGATVSPQPPNPNPNPNMANTANTMGHQPQPCCSSGWGAAEESADLACLASCGPPTRDRAEPLSRLQQPRTAPGAAQRTSACVFSSVDLSVNASPARQWGLPDGNTVASDVQEALTYAKGALQLAEYQVGGRLVPNKDHDEEEAEEQALNELIISGYRWIVLNGLNPHP